MIPQSKQGVCPSPQTIQLIIKLLFQYVNFYKFEEFFFIEINLCTRVIYHNNQRLFLVSKVTFINKMVPLCLATLISGPLHFSIV